MKKTYIKPTNIVVRLNTETLIAASPDTPLPNQVDIDEVIDNSNQIGGREYISTPDAWDEW